MEIDTNLDVTEETRIDTGIVYISVGLFSLTLLLATFQVLIRELPFNINLNFIYYTEPLSRFVLIVMTFFGAAVAARNNEHLKIGIIVDKISYRWPSMRAPINIVTNMLILVFLYVMIKGCLLNTFSDWQTTAGGVPGLTTGMLYLGMAIGLIFMALFTFKKLLEEAAKLGTDNV